MINIMAGEAHLDGSRASAWRSATPRSRRQRLLGAITRLAIGDGYDEVTVARVIAAAEVSRTTFYQHFEDREACFAAALALLSKQLLGSVREAVARAEPERALDAAAQTLIAYPCSQPAQARLLMSDALSGGDRLRDVRDELIDEAAQIVERAHALAPADALLPALPPRLVLGAVWRMLASRVRRGADSPTDLAGDLADLSDWIAAYELPAEQRCWRALARLTAPARSPFLSPIALGTPPASTPRRARAGDSAHGETHWLAIVLAAAEVVRHDGFAAATVARIAAAAGVDARAFYRLFANKQQALAAANELLFRHAMAAAAGAFVIGETWPQRVWEAARALTQYAAQNPTLTYVALVESCAGDSSEVPCVEELAQAFTIFLQEGYPQRREPSAGAPSGPSELALEAISMAVFELAYRHLREYGATSPYSRLGQILFIALAPFVGAREADDLARRQTPYGRGRADLASAA
jgi:AcrR family transcriptional regulator